MTGQTITGQLGDNPDEFERKFIEENIHGVIRMEQYYTIMVEDDLGYIRTDKEDGIEPITDVISRFNCNACGNSIEGTENILAHVREHIRKDPEYRLEETKRDILDMILEQTEGNDREHLDTIITDMLGGLMDVAFSRAAKSF